MIQIIAMIVFFLAIGVHLIWALPYTALVAGIAAIAAGLAMIIER